MQELEYTESNIIMKFMEFLKGDITTIHDAAGCTIEYFIDRDTYTYYSDVHYIYGICLKQGTKYLKNLEKRR